MAVIYKCFTVALLLSCVSGLIIPDEITSLLSLVYSNIPPIKKGTDSRLGVGFRLGPHADFQVVLELGPQSNTQPIGPSAETKRRRQSGVAAGLVETTSDTRRRQNVVGVDEKTGSIPSTWLSKWRASLLRQNQKSITAPTPNVASKRQTVTTTPTLSAKTSSEPTEVAEGDIMKHLHQLFDTKTATGVGTNVTKTS